MIPPNRTFGPAADVPPVSRSLDVPGVRHPLPRGRPGVARGVRARARGAAGAGRVPRGGAGDRRRARGGFDGGKADRHAWLGAGGAVPRGADAELRATAGGRQRLLPAGAVRGGVGPRGRTAAAPAECRGIRFRGRRAGHRLQPDRVDPRSGFDDAERSGGDRRPLRSHGDREAGRGRLDLQRGRRRRLRCRHGSRRGPGARAGSAPAQRHRSPHQRRGVRSLGHPVVRRPSRSPAREHCRRTPGGDGRPPRLPGGRPRQAVAHRLRTLDHG